MNLKRMVFKILIILLFIFSIKIIANTNICYGISGDKVYIIQENGDKKRVRDGDEIDIRVGKTLKLYVAATYFTSNSLSVEPGGDGNIVSEGTKTVREEPSDLTTNAFINLEYQIKKEGTGTIKLTLKTSNSSGREVDKNVHTLKVKASKNDQYTNSDDLERDVGNFQTYFKLLDHNDVAIGSSTIVNYDYQDGSDWLTFKWENVPVSLTPNMDNVTGNSKYKLQTYTECRGLHKSVEDHVTLSPTGLKSATKQEVKFDNGGINSVETKIEIEFGEGQNQSLRISLVDNLGRQIRLIITFKVTVANTGLEQQLENDSQNAENQAQYANDLENAWQHRPGPNATADEIRDYVYSGGHHYGDYNILRNVESTTIARWIQTLQAALTGTIERQMYQPTIDILQRIQSGNEENLEYDYDNSRVGQAQDLAEEYQDTLEETIRQVRERAAQAQSVLESLFSNSEEDTGEFLDVLRGETDEYIPEDDGSNDRLEDMINTVLSVITNIGMIIAVLMSAIIGIKYMLGSLEERADYKGTLIPYLTGALLLFGICTVIKIVQAIGNSINGL